MIEIDVMAKDTVKLYMLSEIESGATEFMTFIEVDGKEKNIQEVRTGLNTYRLNNFSVTEDASENTICFRPVVIGCYAYFKIKTAKPSKLQVVHKDGTLVKETNLEEGEIKITFTPQKAQKYICAVEDALPLTKEALEEMKKKVALAENTKLSLEDQAKQLREKKKQIKDRTEALEIMITKLKDSTKDVEEKRLVLEEEYERLERAYEELEAQRNSLTEKKETLERRMRDLQAEYDKDYSLFASDIEEIKSKCNVDKELIEIYSERDVVPVEHLIENADSDIVKIEDQIKLFVEAKQRKTAEIEKG